MDHDDEKYTEEIYAALMGENHSKVIELCSKVSKGGLHNITIHGNTVLHMAAYGTDPWLMVELVNQLPHKYHKELASCLSNSGNTILHEAAKFSRHIPAAREYLSKEPKLLNMANDRGETPLFRAARYGKSKMFLFLDSEVEKVTDGVTDLLREFHVRADKNTILHAAILTEHFDLALLIAEKYEYLIPEEDRDGMTALQLLACNPSAFSSGSSLNLFERLIYARKICFNWPFWDEIRKKKKRRESASKLATLLIERDMSWKLTGAGEGKCLPKTHRFKKASQDHNMGDRTKSLTDKGNINDSIPHTPLLLATESGCIEIVKGILDKHPQAVSHVDSHGSNILHIAIKHRQLRVFDIVEKMKIPMKKLIEKHDNEGNSILHMVGLKAEELVHKDMRVPAVILQEDLLLFERIEKIAATHVTKHMNSEGKTAKKLLTDSNAHLHSEAKEWMKRTAENCSIVAVLIATVAFAAAYTVPGGPNDKGYPILENNPFFDLFTIADVLSLGFALTAVIIFLSILTSSFRLKDFRRLLPQKLMLGVTMLILSVSMMMLAFAATVILLIHNKEKWTRISLYSVAFFPVTVFGITYLPLYLSLMETFKNSLGKIWSYIPRFRNHTKFVKFQASNTSTLEYQANRCPV